MEETQCIGVGLRVLTVVNYTLLRRIFPLYSRLHHPHGKCSPSSNSSPLAWGTVRKMALELRISSGSRLMLSRVRTMMTWCAPNSTYTQRDKGPIRHTARPGQPL